MSSDKYNSRQLITAGNETGVQHISDMTQVNKTMKTTIFLYSESVTMQYEQNNYSGYLLNLQMQRPMLASGGN